MAQLTVRGWDGGHFYHRNGAGGRKKPPIHANPLFARLRAARSKIRSRFYRRPQRSQKTFLVLSAFVANQIRDHLRHSRALPFLLSCVSWANPFESILSCFDDGPPASGGPTTDPPASLRRLLRRTESSDPRLSALASRSLGVGW